METYKVKSITISRKPGENKDGFKTAFIGLFTDNNPHLKAKVPLKVLEFKNTEKVRIRELRNISYYLAGNDIVINDLLKVNFDVKKNVLTITGEQELPELD
ncbi:hypothetical protein COY27_06225 [Candidatus Woesearchaeota archaeon CG_4_10_14_0_2_um_filter_33_13]|nr:MAG: hypothetical protein COY27_06225 [Candidatus Woesearchaeota archaeon CG_4_10_14_0_2_um_filter_33_13]